MAKIHLFETRRIPDVERLRGLSVERLSPLVRTGRWRRTMPHAEPFANLIWLARGQGRIVIRGGAVGYGPGTLAVIPARTPFALRYGTVTEGTLVRWPDLLEAPLPQSPLRIRLSDIGAQGELSGLLERLAQAGDLNDPPSGRAALGRLILLSALVERHAEKGETLAAKGEAAERAGRFADAIEATLAHGAPQESVIARAGGTMAQIDASLDAACGLRAETYRTERVMHEARRRLADTRSGLQAIAHDLSFPSAKALDDALRAAGGCDAATFREREGRGQTRI